VSHDLRNPLQVATGHLHLAGEGEGDVTDHIEAAESALDRMAALIDDSLTLARQGRDIGETEPTALDRLAERAWSNVETTDGTLTLEAPPTLECDPDRVVELLENLFRNALTHGAGEDAEVTVTVGAIADGFYVADDGIGIPAGDADRVFDSGFTTDEEGTGLGLDIVQTIAEAHGWTVTATESDSGGARFEFR
jgi:signal transduction histidine kinase